MTSILENGNNSRSSDAVIRGFVPNKSIAAALAAWAILNMAIQSGIIHVPLTFDPRIIPREYLFHSAPLEAMLSVMVLITCYYLTKGKKLAWNVSIGTLSLSIFLHMLHRNRGIDPVLLFSVSIIVALVMYRNRFRISGRLTMPSQRRDRETANIITVFAFILSISAVAFYIHRNDFGPVPGMTDSLWLSILSSVMADTTRIYHPLSNRAVMLIELVTAAYIVLYSYATSFVFTWLFGKNRLSRNKAASQAVLIRQIIDVYGRHSINCFATSPEKQIFVSSDTSTLISCRIVSGIALALGDPIGPIDRKRQAIKEFRSFCQEADLIPAFYHGHQSTLPVYRALQMKEIKIGEEAIIDPLNFELTGPPKKNLRNSIAAATRGGINVKIFQPSDIINNAHLCSQLDDISADWQTAKGKKNIGFSCTKIHRIMDLLIEADREESASSGNPVRVPLFVAVAYHDGNLPCAFAVVRIYPNNCGATLDALRRAKNSPNGAIELLIYSIIMALKAIPTIREFSLGLAPLADSLNDVAILNGQPLGWKSIIEKIGFSIGNATTALYNYNQLFKFKSKFNPQWQPRYLVIPSMSSLPKVLYSITKAHLQ